MLFDIVGLAVGINVIASGVSSVGSYVVIISVDGSTDGTVDGSKVEGRFLLLLGDVDGRVYSLGDGYTVRILLGSQDGDMIGDEERLPLGN